MTQKQIQGDCKTILADYPADYFDAAAIDPPSAINFMGQVWDSDKGGWLHWVQWLADCTQELFRTLKPGAHAVVWALPRTSYMTGFALRLAGFEIRDVITHVFSTGFPKNYDVAKGIESLILTGSANWNEFRKLNGKAKQQKALGFNELQAEQGYRPEVYTSSGGVDFVPTTDEGKAWLGWGTALKPAHEQWYLVRKPLERGLSVAQNVLKWNTGALNLAACRVGNDSRLQSSRTHGRNFFAEHLELDDSSMDSREVNGRWPANMMYSHSVFCTPVGQRQIERAAPDKANQKNPYTNWAVAQERPATYEYSTGDVYGQGFNRDQPGTQHLSELVTLWDCAPGCPVAELNGQYIPDMAGRKKKAREISQGKGSQDIYRRGFGGRRDPGNTYDAEDIETADRFFPIFNTEQSDLDLALFAYIPKPATSERNAGLDALPTGVKVYNGQSGKPSADPGAVERRFTTLAKNIHPTVKSVALMRYLLTLITPPGGQVVDCFAGSGSTGLACLELGFDWVGIDQDSRYCEIANARLAFAALPPEVKQARREQFWIDWGNLDND